MSVLKFIRRELKGWGKVERVVFPLGILAIIILSFIMNDSKVALISAVCGVSYSIFAGKGKISCYFFGLCGTLCYSYISLKNHLFGNLCLYMLFYLPMQVTGIFKWKQHLKKDSQEIEKTELSKRDGVVYLVLSVLLTFVAYLILYKIHDSITTVFSVIGMILTVKRCIEQWYVWFVVNGLSVVMWIKAYALGSNCFATILMWAIYFVLSIYFLYTWKKELNGRLK